MVISFKKLNENMFSKFWPYNLNKFKRNKFSELLGLVYRARSRTAMVYIETLSQKYKMEIKEKLSEKYFLSTAI